MRIEKRTPVPLRTIAHRMRWIARERPENRDRPPAFSTSSRAIAATCANIRRRMSARTPRPHKLAGARRPPSMDSDLCHSGRTEGALSWPAYKRHVITVENPRWQNQTREISNFFPENETACYRVALGGDVPCAARRSSCRSTPSVVAHRLFRYAENMVISFRNIAE